MKQIDLFIQVDGELKPTAVFSRVGESKSYGCIRFEECHYNQHGFEKAVILSCILWANKHLSNEMVAIDYRDGKFTIRITVVHL